MIDERKVFERSFRRYEPEGGSFERLARRRDRKRRNQRIAAGVVGIAVFVAAVWIVTSGGVFDRSPTSVVPAGTGPVQTGPAETGPAVTGPPYLYDPVPRGEDPSFVGFEGGLPPEGVLPSEPLRGELVMEDGSIPPSFWWHTNLYADGRLIWATEVPADPGEGGPKVSVWIEQRLTPEGVALLRSGAVPLGRGTLLLGQLPASAWEDPDLRPYVPSTYAVCAESLASLPDPAADLLRSTERIPAGASRYIEGAECFEVTIEDARALAEILSGAGFDDPRAEDTALYSSDANDVTVEYQLILPDGFITVPIGG